MSATVADSGLDRGSGLPPTPTRLRVISRSEHLAFVATQPFTSFLQCPSWADVKVGWTAESLGWEDASGRIIGVALALYRQAPKVKRYFAYLPEGPVIDWTNPGPWLDLLQDYLRDKGVFTVKIGPLLAVRRWQAETLKKAIAEGGEGSGRTLRDVPADHLSDIALRAGEYLRSTGWLNAGEGESSTGDVQPRYVFEVPLDGGPDQVWGRFNQQWRRNIKKAEKSGVVIEEGGYEDLPAFFRLLEVTQERDGFHLGRTLKYYQRQFEALRAEAPERMRLYLARHEGEVLAAATSLQVGDRIWFQSGGSANHKREVRPSNALQWRMINEAIGHGASVYDMRGVGDTLDPKVRKFGLINFKLGTGGEAVELLGEWDFPLNKVLHKAFDFYMSHR